MEKGICSGCGKETWIQNKTKNFCAECIYRRGHEGKNSIEISQEKYNKRLETMKKNGTSYKGFRGRPTFIKRQNKFTKSTGEKQLFLEIWEERPHYCTNPKCRKFLGLEPKTFFFSHIKPKSIYPELRLQKENIRLLCFDCHFAVDHQGVKIEDE